MTALVLIGFGLLGAAADGPSDGDRAAYQAAAAKAGPGAEAQVKLALWCEAHGMQAERLKHLGLAVLKDPANAAARGLLGLVADDDQWRDPDAVAGRIKADEDLSAKLAEYESRRAEMPDTADGHWKLALWCAEQGLEPEARAHFTAVTRLDPGRDVAWKRLGYVKRNGRWTSPAQQAAEKHEADLQRKADRAWHAAFVKHRNGLASPGRRDAASAALEAVTDPRAVPMAWKVFANGGTTDQLRAARLFGQIEGPAASRALALLGAATTSDEVRTMVMDALKRRDPREYVGVLVASILDPIKYEVKHVGGPGKPGALFVAGEQFDVRRNYLTPLPSVSLQPGDTLGYDAFGLPVISRIVGYETTNYNVKEPLSLVGPLGADGALSPVEAGLERDIALARAGKLGNPRDPIRNFVTERPVEAEIPVGRMLEQAGADALEAERRLQADVRTLKAMNEAIHAANARILPILKAVTDKELGEDREAWRAWWTDREGYAYTPPPTPAKPVVVEDVAPTAPPEQVPVDFKLGRIVDYFGYSCFGAGTAVRTRDGARPIESIKAGDVVLVQDTASGRLGFQPVLAVFHNKPAATLRIDFGDEEVVATPIHRFWVAGQGWRMARELKVGDRVRSVGGTLTVASIRPDRVQPVYNLEVSDGHNFFVGRRGALVHDNSLVRPIEHPFDAVPTAPAQAGAEK